MSDAETRMLDLVDEWHESDSPLPIYGYLGLTWQQYAAWVEQRMTDAEALAIIDGKEQLA